MKNSLLSLQLKIVAGYIGALSSPDLSDDMLRNIANKVADMGKRVIEQVEASMKEDGDA